MITVEQIKAGRALLDWTQDDLARAANLSKPAINTLERRIANPRMETLASIQRAMEKAGVEFTEGPGVKLRTAVLKTQIFEGDDALVRLVHDIFETLSRSGGTLMIAGIAEEKYAHFGGENIKALIDKRVRFGIPTQLLACEGDDFFLEPIHHYRWIEPDLFPATPWYVYDNKYAILLWGPPKKVVQIENADIAECYRQQFQALWRRARPVPAKVVT